MPRFFVPKENITDDKIIITSGDVAHITRVLRMGAGDKILVCDGKGFEYDAEIVETGKKEIIFRVLEKTESKNEPNISVTLYQGVPKGGKMEYIIQKTTELGITSIVPVEMARCVSKIKGGDKIERWNKISAEAAKQSQRGIVPRVCEPMSFREAAERMKKDDLFFAPYECEETGGLKNTLLSKKDVKTVSFMIGPEGGFDLSEIEALKAAGIPTVTLGRRILRTETAGEAVLAMIMYEIGDVNN
ncbi:MAG: 16S rRNA (uracil(1498)-N(3))-methyltransferase [Firmicutes bacterium]|nr:16S rRNA (uracil(1498)-N(3))-methyltransferase [Bacillota bacterium]